MQRKKRKEKTSCLTSFLLVLNTSEAASVLTLFSLLFSTDPYTFSHVVLCPRLLHGGVSRAADIAEVIKIRSSCFELCFAFFETVCADTSDFFQHARRRLVQTTPLIGVWHPPDKGGVTSHGAITIILVLLSSRSTGQFRACAARPPNNLQLCALPVRVGILCLPFASPFAT